MPRYALNETAPITSQFAANDTVTIDIYDLSDNSKVVDAAACTEVDSAGAFKYLYTPNPGSKKDYMWVMSNGSYTRKGQVSFGNVAARVADKGVLNNPPSENINDYKADVSGLATQSSVTAIATDVIRIKTIEEGRWKIVNDQLICYDTDKVTPLITFNLFDENGDPVTDNPRERVPA